MQSTQETWKKGYEVMPTNIQLPAISFRQVQDSELKTSSSELDALFPDDPQKAERSYRKTIRSIGEVKGFAEQSLLALGFSDLSVAEQLQDLAAQLIKRFKLNYLHCRMDLVYTDSCRKFHIDNLYTRAITTLIGPGTEYKLMSKSNEVLQVKTGETILLKGLKHRGRSSKIVHKSPKISHLNTYRLVFVMDY